MIFQDIEIESCLKNKNFFNVSLKELDDTSKNYGDALELIGENLFYNVEVCIVRI